MVKKIIDVNANIKLNKQLQELFTGVTVGVKKRKYRKGGWSTVEVAEYAEAVDKVLSNPWNKLTSKDKKTLEKAILETSTKGTISRKTQQALNNIIVNPILAKKYGKNKQSTLDYKTGNVKWLNTGTFIKSIVVSVKTKKTKKTKQRNSSIALGLLGGLFGRKKKKDKK